MKIEITMNRSRSNQRRNSAFTLIEMIGVLAIIAILAALLLPKVFNAINEARINNASVSIQTMKTAITDHYGKYGSLAVSNTTPLTTFPVVGFDTVLIGEGLIDKLFTVKICTNGVVQLSSTGGNESTIGPGFNLGGGVNTVPTNPGGQTVVAEVVLPGVAQQDAYDLKAQIDGSGFETTNAVTAAESSGMVEYDAPSTSGITTVYVYLTGR